LKIVILGPDGAGKSSVIAGLVAVLNSKGHTVKVRYLKPQIILPRQGSKASINTDPHGMKPHSILPSLAKIFIWLLEEWYANLFQDKRNMLLICDRYYHDLLVDPWRFRYGGPGWAAKFVGKLMPNPKLWVLLDASAEILQARKQEVSAEETKRQRQAYIAFTCKQREHVIVDASQPLDRVITDVNNAISRALLESEGICD